jgi:hypothetical protein
VVLRLPYAPPLHRGGRTPGWSYDWRKGGPMLLAELSSRWSYVTGGRHLAIAFETLLTDSFASGVRHRVVRRVGLLLAADQQRDELLRAVDSMYSTRGRLMHGEEVGEPESPVQSRRAFIHAFVALVERLPGSLATAPADAPMRHICRDRDDHPRWRQRADARMKRSRSAGNALRRLIRPDAT